jgi:hypothetical protein
MNSSTTGSEIQKLEFQLAAEKHGQDVILSWVEIAAGVLGATAVLAFIIQIWTLFSDTANRRRNQEERVVQSTREGQLHEGFLKILDIATKAAEDAQLKVATLGEGGIRRAGETLQLINNLLAITERAAAKAAGAQFEFLSRTIGTLDASCRALIVEATEKDDRDIIAKPVFAEKVRVLTGEIDAIDHQISTYNASVPSQFREVGDGQDDRAHDDDGVTQSWMRLCLTGPCLFVRGQDHLQNQNFNSAIDDWKQSLVTRGSESVRVDANYWIGYLNNTLGNFDKSPEFLKAAAAAAGDQRKPELLRLELETRFFSLDDLQVPDEILNEGERIFATLQPHVVPPRTISSFATTMGNIAFVQSIRRSIKDNADFDPRNSSAWFQRAISAMDRSRWARFGMCQDTLLSGKTLDEELRRDLADVVGSAQREYQNREEDRSKVLSKVTEYICMVILDSQKENTLSAVAASVELHASRVRARTIYSQFRKQNVDKEIFLREFKHFQESRNLAVTCRMANTPSARTG